MIKRIILENFMSHARTVIEPGAGLTLLVGPNNCGKSAVVEALRILCRNLPGEVALRHGEKTCRVIVETDDGHVVTWQRRKAGSIRYEIDGKADDRPGRAVPDGLHDALRLPEVEAAGDTFDIHIGLQKSPLFLLGEKSESKIAAFFASSSDAEKLMEMQARHRERVRNARQRVKDDQEDLERLDRRLLALSPLDGIGPMLDGAEEEHAAIRVADQAAAELAALLDDIASMTRRREECSARGAVLNELDQPPALQDTTRLECCISDIDASLKTRRKEQHRLSAVSPLTAPPILAETASLEHLIANFHRAGRHLDSATRSLAATATLAPPPTINDPIPLQRTCDALSAASRAASAADSVAAAVRPLADPPLLIDTTALERLQAQLSEHRERATQFAVDVVAIDQAIEAVQGEILAWARRNPTCPLCGGVVDPEQVLNHDHSHA